MGAAQREVPRRGTAWGLTSQGSFGSQAGVAGRTDPAFVIEGLSS